MIHAFMFHQHNWYCLLSSCIRSYNPTASRSQSCDMHIYFVASKGNLREFTKEDLTFDVRRSHILRLGF